MFSAGSVICYAAQVFSGFYASSQYFVDKEKQEKTFGPFFP